MSRAFWLIDTNDRNIVTEFHSKTPRDAALKAATREEESICLAEAGGKLHVFRGEKVPLTAAEENTFTRSRNIVAKPRVRKMAYYNLGRPISKQEVGFLCDVLREIM